MGLIPRKTLTVINPNGGSYIDGKWTPGTNFKSMPKNLSDLLKSKSLIFWTPFNEDNHHIGYTPNVANEGDATVNMAFLDENMNSNEGIVNGNLKLIDMQIGFVNVTTTAALKIIGDLTIVLRLRIIDPLTYNSGIISHSERTEAQADNFLYGAYILPDRRIIITHEYDAGQGVNVDTNTFWPNDGDYHMLMIRRNATLMQYEVSIDNSTPAIGTYATSPNGGEDGKLWIGGMTIKCDGEYPDCLIFDEILSNADIDIIYNAGKSKDEWFNYDNWDNAGTGYVTWLIGDEAFTIQASVQPLTPREMEMLPEGRRNRESYRLYTQSYLKTIEENLENPSTVKIEHEYFEVFSRATWNNDIIPHYKYIVTKVNQC